jgi:hypothetical protein
VHKSSAYNLLLDIDCLFDTRMGTLIDLDPKVTTYLSGKAYRERLLDDYTALTQGHITTEAFNARYAKRDLDVLKKSLITGMVPVLITYVEGLKERLFRKVDVSAINIDINIHPYVIPGPFLESIKNCLRHLLPPYVQVGVGSYSRQQLDPEFFDRYYNGWVTYDIHSWLEVHGDALLGKPLNGLSVIVPKLFSKEPGAFETNEGEVFREADKHGLFELVMQDFLHIEHMPVVDFCFIVPGSYRMPEDDEDQSSSDSSNKERSAASTDETKSS